MIGLNKIGLNQVQLNRLRLNAPFPAYGKMAGGGGSGDGFPQLPGDVTRWHFGGLTNEMMAAMDDPRIEDADGKGRFLSFKNFAWAGMSGVGGYKYNFLSNDWSADVNQLSVVLSHKIVIINKRTSIQLAKWIRNELENTINITLKITGLEANGSSFKIYDNVGSSHAQEYNKDGIYQINYTATEGANSFFLYVSGGNMGQLEHPITIEQLPLYPGFILADGVDDFAVTEEDFNFEKEFCVYLAAIFFPQDSPHNDAVLGKDSNKDIRVLQYNNNLTFNSGNHTYCPVSLGQFSIVAFKRKDDTLLAKNLTTGVSNSVKATSGVLENPDKFYLWVIKGFSGYSDAAIAGSIIVNGHFTTDEDDEKVLDWYKKQYPWLFPDQAWTVTGKTNEDEDRATIANITGNGNNLVLSNFGFAEGSGYGLYKLNFNNWFANSGSGNVNIVNVVNPHKIVLEQSQEAVGAFFLGKNVSYSGELKISVSNKPSDIELSFGSTALGKVILNEGINIVKINPVNTSIGFFTNKAFEAQNIIIEQIPECEGYLMTDGVDDKAVSKQFKFGENFTVILDFKFPVKKISYCGFDLSSKVRIQNLQGSGVYVVLKGNKTLIPSNVVRAVTSEGKVYDENWNEYNIVPGNISSNYTMVNLGFDGSNQFAESATKLAGIYSSTLSKDDCIKAYNYLQTLKAK